MPKTKIIKPMLWWMSPLFVANRVATGTLLKWHRPVFYNIELDSTTYWPVWYAWAGISLHWTLTGTAKVCWWLHDRLFRRAQTPTVRVEYEEPEVDMTTGTDATTVHVIDGKPHLQCRRGCFHEKPRIDQWPPLEDWSAYHRHECDHDGEVILATGIIEDGLELGYCSCAANVFIRRLKA